MSGVGVPQGGVLFPILFSMALRKIGNILPEGVKIVMYADIIIYVSGHEIKTAQEFIQQTFEIMKDWLLNVGLEISMGKTKCTIFSRRRETRCNNYSISLSGQELIVEESIKYLGVVLDQGLLWHHQINENVRKAKPVLNIIKVLGGVTWGPTPSSLMKVTESMIMSVLG